MSDTPDSSPSRFDVFAEVIGLWKWSFRNLGALVRVSWLAAIITFAGLFAFAPAIFPSLVQQTVDASAKGSGDPSLETITSVSTAPAMSTLLAAYLIMSIFMLVLYAIPIAGATRLARDPSFRKTLRLGYLRFGGPEIRIGMLLGLMAVVVHSVLFSLQLWLVGDMFAMMDQARQADPAANPEAWEELMRLDSIASGIAMVVPLVAAYFYARLLPAIPIIVSGRRGLRIRQAWRMTKGKGMTLFGAVLLAYIFLIAGTIGLGIAALIVFATVGAILALINNSALAVLLLPIWIALMFAGFGFYIGYFQRLQVRAHEWVSAQAES